MLTRPFFLYYIHNWIIKFKHLYFLQVFYMDHLEVYSNMSVNVVSIAFHQCVAFNSNRHVQISTHMFKYIRLRDQFYRRLFIVCSNIFDECRWTKHQSHAFLLILVAHFRLTQPYRTQFIAACPP